MPLIKISTTAINDASITSEKIANGAVTAADLHTTAVTDKLGFTPVTDARTITINGTSYDLTANRTWTVTSASTPTQLSDQSNSSTGYFDLPSGTTAQRPVSPDTGMIRYNNDLGVLEQYTPSGWLSIDSPPSISSFSGIINADTSSTITVNGSNFKSGSVVYIEGAAVSNVTRPLTTSYINSSQLTANTAATSTNYTGGASFDIRVLNPSGLSGILYNAGNIDRDPVWSTSAGSIGTIYDSAKSSVNLSVSASDPEGTSVTYSLVSGSLPTGITLNTSTGAITGSTSAVASDTTYTFTIRATSNSQSVDRTFTTTVKAPVIETFTSVGTQSWTVPSGVSTLSALVIGAGGGAGGNDGASSPGNGGGSGGGVYTIFNISSGTTLTIAVGGGGGGGADTCNGFSVDDSRGPGGTNGGGTGGRAGSTPCSGGGAGGGGWSGIYVGGTYYAVAGGGGGGGGANEGNANDLTSHGGGNQPNGSTGSMSGGNGADFSGDGGGYGGGGGGLNGGNGANNSYGSQGGQNYYNPSNVSGTTYTGNNSNTGIGGSAGGNLSVAVASIFGYGNNYGGGGNPGGNRAASGSQGIVYLKY